MGRQLERAVMGVAVAIALVLAPACSHDVVLPSQESAAVCGDGVVQAGEECDASAPGCVDCRVVPGYACAAGRCDVVCGDGVIGDGPSCANARKVEACDMTGYWVARETDFRRDRVIGAIQTTSTWLLYRFSQTGTAVEVEESLFCGQHTTGTATVDLTPASLRALLTRNDPTPAGKHGPRRGTFGPAGAGCAMTFDRFYTIRGGTQDLLPADFGTHLPFSALPKLPSEADPLHPTGASLTYAEDTDGNGVPGFASSISGIVNGVRDMAQREYKEYATAPGAAVPANALEITVPGALDAEESVLGVSQCGDACALIAAIAGPARDVTPRMTLRYLGKTLSGPRVSRVVRARPRDSVDADLDTCANVRLTLPHDPAQQ